MLKRPPKSTPFPTRRSSDLPLCAGCWANRTTPAAGSWPACCQPSSPCIPAPDQRKESPTRGIGLLKRSEEHTSELQSRENLVCRLLLEKKKTDELFVIYRME